MTRSPDKSPTPSWLERLREAIGIDLRSLALYRIALGVVLIGDLATRLPDLRALHTDEGVLPREAVTALYDGMLRYHPHYYCARSVPAQGALFWLSGLVHLALLLGFRARLACALAWYLTLGLHRLNPEALGGGDLLLRLLLFWGMFLPLGARFSVDAWLARRRSGAPAGPAAERTGRAGAGPGSTDWRPLVSLPGVFLLLQIAMVYWFTAAMKSGPTWWDGSALLQALRNEYLVTEFGAYVRSADWLLTPLTYATLALEIAGPLVAFLPVAHAFCRLAAVLAFMLFHAGIAATMDVGIFPYACMAAWLVFLPAAVWDRRRSMAPAVVGLAPAGADRSDPAGPVTASVERPRRAWPRVVRDVLASAAFAYVLIVNLAQLPWRDAVQLWPLVRWANPLASALMLQQRWSMFAPDPRPVFYWYVFDARLADGSHVDPFAGGRPVTFDRPRRILHTFPSTRWMSYLVNLPFDEPQHQARRLHLSRYVTRQWDRAHPDRRIERLTVHVVLVRFHGWDEDPPQRQVLAEYVPRLDGTAPGPLD